jgi:hypothetical protein
MYATIRRYKTSSAAEVTRKVEEEFIPLISKVPDFVAYNLIDTGEGVLASVSFFQTKEGEEESNRVAADWVKTLSGLLGPVEITAGEVVAQKW